MVTIGIEKGTGHIYQLDCVRIRESDIKKQVNTILDQYHKWGHDQIKVEAVAYQQGLYNLVKNIGAERHIYPPVRAFRPDTDKVRRAMVISASFAGGLVFLRENHREYLNLCQEITEFPQAEHDDAFDSLMAACEKVTKKFTGRSFSQKPRGF